MCGITGYIDFRKKSSEDILSKMVHTLQHRGPDDRGMKTFETTNALIGIGHTRLSILDLSSAGHQPMFYHHMAIVLNGEIYNFKEIREELIQIGHEFISESDTEVVIHAFYEWGLDCVEKFIGMFAFVIYDEQQQKVFLCRDRAGVKPMYYFWKNGLLLFASELKAFHQHPFFEKKINSEALSIYLQYGYVQGPMSIFENCFKQNPGSWLILDLKNQSIEKQIYWDVKAVYQQPILKIDYDEAKLELEKILTSACNYRMVADVPVGVFLSGGYDSTAVTALLQKNATEKLSTFTIGFPDGADEAPYAKEVAKALGTNHTEYNCTYDDAKAIIPDLAYFYDEPCADISAIPTLLVSKIAKQHVTVALSADGGDEVFAGYKGYRLGMERIRKINKLPSFAESSAAFISNHMANVLPQSKISLKHKLTGISKILKSPHDQRMIKLMENSTKLPDKLITKLINNKSLPLHPAFYDDYSLMSESKAGMLLLDFLTTLPDLLLVKVDRASMAVSLESREPFLDHRILEYAAQLPMEYKMNPRTGKRILKDIVHKYIDKSIMDRPKMGFDLPIYKWLRNDLAYLVDEYLSEQRIRKSACFDEQVVKDLVISFKIGKLQYESLIWRLIHFQMWHERWMN
ncbi:MAG: asparagine synthase (glutamine-hydrolyzing) [Saprospiraceae bacterium]